MQLQPIVRRSVADGVYDQLVGRILDGDLEPGASLPAERSLTELLGVNRQAVREALQRLAQSGLVEIRQGEPTRVTDYRRHGGLDLLPSLLVDADGRLDVAVIRSVIEMRACVGPDIARRCAQRATPAHVDALRMAVAAMDDPAAELGALATANLELWDVLADGADNVAYRLAFNSLRRSYEPVAAALADMLADELRDIGSRHRLLDAVHRGDGERAAAAAAALLAPSTARLTELLAELPATITGGRR